MEQDQADYPRKTIIPLVALTLVAPCFVALAVCLDAVEVPDRDAQTDLARQILEATAVEGGLIVHVGCGDGKLTTALRASDACLVHGLDADPTVVAAARRHVRSAGFYGAVSIDRFDGRNLPYVGNSVNLVVATVLGQVSTEELTRVLCPGGVAYVKSSGSDAWTKTVKPWPAEIDQWTHTLYDATGNAVGRDAVVGPPHHIQWIGRPRRARQHERLASISAVVSAGGRIFSIQDEGSVASIVLPANWLLVARDAFNGTVLWTREIDTWEGHLRPMRMGPPNLARRLVAAGDRVYVTPGYGTAVSALDAATGETIREYEGTAGTSEILWHDGSLLLVAGAVHNEAARRRGAAPAADRKHILAIDAESGKLRWNKSDAQTAGLMPNTLATDGRRVFFQNSREIVCLDYATGNVTWRAARPVVVKRPGFSSPTLVVYRDVLLSADRAAPGMVEKEPQRLHRAGYADAPRGTLIAFSAETGKQLWSCPCRECFNAPVDVLVAGGLVWTGELILDDDPGITVGRDPQTGEIKRRRPADEEFFQVGMPHHRCHRNRATDRYLVLGRAGVEFIDLKSGEALPHHWVRGTCQHGTLPCNGLLYAPPHSCACYTRAKLNGFVALAAKRGQGEGTTGGLQRGPAYTQISNPQSPIPNPSAWPTYRHDVARSGRTTASVAAKLQPKWKTELGGRLSSVTIADGKVCVASIDTHTVHALDAESGRDVWQFTTGGRVDSPPTICNGRATFGSADGSVYCLRASDGALLWRYRAAPADRRIVAYGQLESTSPVHGSVLVVDAVVCFAAGRSSYLDRGIRLVRLDLNTGKLLSETTIDSRDPETGRQPKGSVEAFDLPGALPDVLSVDETSIYMRHLRFDLQGTRQAEEKTHLFCPTGLLDDSWWHRSYWILGKRFYTGYRDWFRAGREVPGGRLLVLGDSTVYGFGRTPAHYYWSSPLGYHLFATDRSPKIVPSETKHPGLPEWGRREIEYGWSAKIALRARAMVLAAETLFVAGPPELIDEEEAYSHHNDATWQTRLAEQDDALRGRKDATLLAVSTADGKMLTETPLESPPTFDGMGAAYGRLYYSTQSGKVVCLAASDE